MIAVMRGGAGFVRGGALRDNHGMIRVSIEDIERDLAVYLKRVEAGETLVIVRAGHPVVEMKPIERPIEQLRPFGLCAGEFVVPDDFDAPLPEDLLSAFEGM